MRLKVRNSGHFVFELAAYREYLIGEDNGSRRSHLRKVLMKAIDTELTEKQRECVVDYYINNKSMKDIAREQDVHPSTVTRHIKRAEEKLRHIAEYC